MTKFKKIIASIASIAIVLTTSVTSVQAYSDISSGDWFAPYVQALWNAWIFDNSIDMFRPWDNMNRAEFVKTLVAASWISTDNVASAWFSDVTNQWFAPFVNAAASKGIIDGPMSSKGNKFFPNDNISRAAAVKIALWAFSVDADKYQDPKPSFNDISWHWGEKFITAAYNLSIVDWVGGSKYTFAPEANITRSAVAKVAAFAVIVSDDPGTYVRFEDGTSAFSPFTSDDVQDMVKDIVGKWSDDVAEDNDDDEDDTTTTTVAWSDWSLEISLSADSPKGAVIPYWVSWVEFTKFDLTANWDDVLVTSITLVRKGLGSKDDFTEVVIFDSAWARISKTKSFNSDDEANITFDKGWLLISSWETRTISVRASIWWTVLSHDMTSNRDAITIQWASAVSSNATEVVWDFPINWSTFEIGSQRWGSLEFKTSSSVSNVKIWDEEVSIMKFTAQNDSVEDIYLKWITLKELSDVDEEEDIMNLKLFNWTNLLWSQKIMNSKYVTFMFDEPLLIKEGKTEKFTVKADVVWWADKNIFFSLERGIDVLASWKKYWYGAAITWSLVSNTVSTSGPNYVTIKAWKVSIVKIEPESEKVRKNKSDVVFWKFKLITNAWKNLEFTQIKLDITQQTAAWSWVLALLKNIELYDETKWATFDLSDSTIASTTKTIQLVDSDLWISLADGETRVFAIRADTQDVATISWASFKFSIAGIWDTTGGIVVMETDNDTNVSDITPKSLSYNAVEWQTSSAQFSVHSLSSTKNVVIGSDNVVALDFQVKADDSTDLNITDITLWQTGNTVWFTTDIINVAKLWKKEWTNETLIAESSDIAGGNLTFEDLNINVPKDEEVRFIVTVNAVDDATNVAKTIIMEVRANWISLEDQDDEDVTWNTDALVSARKLVIVWKWSLDAQMDNGQEGPGWEWNIDNMQNLLAWTTTDFVAAIKLKATNEPIILQDVALVLYNNWSAFTTANTVIRSISFYADDWVTLVAQEAPTGGNSIIEFTNFNKTVWTTTEYLYVKYDLTMMWEETGAAPVDALNMAFKVTKAKWDSSWLQLTNLTDTLNSTSATLSSWMSTKSMTWIITAVKIAWVDLVDSAPNGANTKTKASSSQDISWDAVIIGIIKVDVANTSNKDTWNNDLKLVLNRVKLQISKNATMTFKAEWSEEWLWIKRVWWDNRAYINQTASWADGAAFADNTAEIYAVFDTSTWSAWAWLWNEAEVTPGTTAYFLVEANLVDPGTDNTDKIQVKLDSLNWDEPANIWAASTTSAANLTWSVSQGHDASSVLERRTNLYLWWTSNIADTNYRIAEIWD